MPLAVTSQESHPQAFKRAQHVGVGGRPERRPEADFAGILDPVDLVEPRPAEDPD